MEAIAIPRGFRVTPAQFEQLADAEQLARLELTKDGFPPIAPDFIIELVSPSDLKNQRYEDLQAKMTSDPAPTTGARERARMQEYLDNGVKLGWLIEPLAKTVEIYRVARQAETSNNPSTLSGEDVLPGFILDLSEIF
jgi:Uma2 family endonuclease